MIGNFPSKRADESLYSLACVYKKRFRIRSDDAVSQDLFGVRRLNDVVDIPRRLQYLADQIPIEFGYTTNYLIWQTSALPYFSPFLTTDELARLQVMMLQEDTGTRAVSTIRRRGPDAPPECLRLCIECCIGDRDDDDGPYWRRTHQSSCVHVCYPHRTMLATTSMLRASSYVSAGEVVQRARTNPRPRSADLEVLLWMGQQVEWLFAFPQVCLDRERLRIVYLDRLYEAGFAFVSGLLRTHELSKALTKKYGKTKLAQYLSFEITETDSVEWIRRVLAARASTAEHLMLMHFLQMRMSDAVEAIAGPAPTWFEPGPWPCLNPLCPRFGEDVIVSNEARVIYGRLVGTFACECGCAYERIGPDREGLHREAPFRPVINHTWDCVVRDLCARTELSLSDIRDQLFTTYVDLKGAMDRAGAGNDVRRNELQALSSGACSPSVDRLSKIEIKRQQKLQAIRAWIKRHPDATRSEIRAGAATAATWLQLHDPQTLIAEMPERLPSANNPTDAWRNSAKVQLSEKDQSLAAKVLPAARTLVSQNRYPQRVTASRILQYIGFPFGLGLRGRAMTLTQAALKECSETLAQCAVRRMQWYVAESKRRGTQLCYSTLMHRSGIRKEWVVQDIAVADAVNSARRELNI